MILEALQENYQLHKLILENRVLIDLIEKSIEVMVNTFNTDRKVISCGNGGSMSDAMHFAEELTGRFRGDRRALPAFAISDPAHMSCVANDYGFEHIFDRTIAAFGKKGDCALLISTSGNSKNIINAAKSAKVAGMTTIGLLGNGGGSLKEMVDIPLIVDYNGSSDRIQEVHILLIHILIEGIERKIFPENYVK